MSNGQTEIYSALRRTLQKKYGAKPYPFYVNQLKVMKENQPLQEFIWPTCFTTGVVPVDRPDGALLADGLSAWSIVVSGSGVKPPECFGDVMVEIGRRLGVTPTADGLMAEANRRREVAEAEAAVARKS